MSSSLSASLPPTFTVERLTQLGRVNHVVPAPCGTWVAVEVSRLDDAGGKYRSDLWRVSVDGSSSPVRLTRGPANNRSPQFRADGGLLFLSNRKASEGEDSQTPKAQIWCLPALGGDAQPLTDEPLGIGSFQVSNDGLHMAAMISLWPDVAYDEQRKYNEDKAKNGPSALHYTSMPIRRWDHWIPNTIPHLISYDCDGSQRRDLVPGGVKAWEGAEWSLAPDGSAIVVTEASPLRVDRIYDQSLVVVDVASGARKVLAEAPKTMFFSPLWSPDSRSIACYRTSRFAEKSLEQVLWCCDVVTGEGKPVAAAWDRWATPAVWKPDMSVLYVLADDHGTRSLFAISLETDAVSRVMTEEAGGCHASVHWLPNDEAMVGIRHRWCHPPEPFYVAAGTDQTPRLLASLSGLKAEEAQAMVSMESFSVVAEDGVPVQSFLYTPNRPDTEQPLPLLFWIHGGPRSHHSDGWHFRWNALLAAAQGFAVACPNPRGSTGFGHDFIAGIWGNQWGAACYRDLMSVADELVARPGIDETRTVAMGGSFGGYMSNWIGVNTERFQCIVTHASLYALSHFFGTTDLPGWASSEMRCSPYTERDEYDRYSPHRLIENWKTPTLVIHGERDFRVPISEALFLFESLQAHGVPSELLVFPDENHWILKPRNICTWYDSVFAFIAKHLAK